MFGGSRSIAMLRLDEVSIPPTTMLHKKTPKAEALGVGWCRAYAWRRAFSFSATLCSAESGFAFEVAMRA